MWAVVQAAVSLFLASFSGRRAFATGAIAIFLFLTWILANIIIQAETPRQAVQAGPGGPGGPGPVGSLTGTAPLAMKIGGLLSPFTLMDGVRRWLGGLSVDQVPRPGSFGVVYAIVLVALVAGCLYGLVIRYRKAALS
jgi:ABC-2 type transport system permease protein